MIVYKEWKKSKNHGVSYTYYRGWFLFGFIPLYVVMVIK